MSVGRGRPLFLPELVGDGQLMPALATTAGQDLAAVRRLHTLAETMYRLAAAAMRLECTFHALGFFTFQVGTGRTVRVFYPTPGHHTRGCEREAKLAKRTIHPKNFGPAR